MSHFRYIWILIIHKSVITALKAGEEKFYVVHRHYFRRLCAFCSQYVGEQEEIIEEIVQETMMGCGKIVALLWKS